MTTRIKNLDKAARDQGRFARRRAGRQVKAAVLQEQRAWWHTAWSRAAAAAKKLRRTISVRNEKAQQLEDRLGVGLELVPWMSTVRQPRYGTPVWVHQHAGRPYRPYRNPDRVERLRRNGRLREDLS